MKIICAPDSFKESMTAEQAAIAMRDGVLETAREAQVDLCPIADGGDGTVDAMLSATGGQPRVTQVAGPLGEAINAKWGVLGDGNTAIIEMAAASGMALLTAARRDPSRTTTYGTGELIRAALDAGAKRILVGIGGSATTDGGCGMAQALGVRFIDEGNRAIAQPMAGGLIQSVFDIDMSQLDPRIADTEIIVACDVTNPLIGPNGAAHIYGPQKGADARMVLELDEALAHLADLIRGKLNMDVRDVLGSGAAGGLGAGLLAFTGATLQSGVDMVLDAVRFDERVASCDICFTGEGRLDGQSVSGKATIGVAQRAASHGVSTIALVGCVGPNVERTLDHGISAYHVISDGVLLDEALRRGPELMRRAAADAMAKLAF
jgi:glycerate kinase